MGLLEDILQPAGEDILAEMGQAAIYLPTNGESVSCMVYVEEDLRISPDNFDLKTYRPTKTIRALYHEIGQIPKKGDRFEVGSLSYAVQTVTDKGKVFLIISVDDGSQIE